MFTGGKVRRPLLLINLPTQTLGKMISLVDVKSNNQYAFIGAKHADLNGDDNNGGVFVYKFESIEQFPFTRVWVQPVVETPDQYGWSLDVDDDQILVMHQQRCQRSKFWGRLPLSTGKQWKHYTAR